ncbi:hypothetical protein CHUAL_001637 [Chamberlinius hualienensis]
MLPSHQNTPHSHSTNPLCGLSYSFNLNLASVAPHVWANTPYSFTAVTEQLGNCSLYANAARNESTTAKQRLYSPVTDDEEYASVGSPWPRTKHSSPYEAYCNRCFACPSNLPAECAATTTPTSSICHKDLMETNRKPFTITSILGLDKTVMAPTNLNNAHQNMKIKNARGNRYPPYRKPGKDTRENPKVTDKAAKSKRVRTIFTTEQLEKLESRFERQQYMIGEERISLANALDLTESQVKVWFQNRRIKYRKLSHETEKAKLAKLKFSDSIPSMDDELSDYED